MQTWFIAINKDVFWVQILKAKYLRGKYFLHDDISHFNSSWFWSDVIKSKNLVLKGDLYSMNVHVDILMWKDPWVPTLDKFILNFDHPNPNSHSLNLVADLIDSRTSSWNLDVLNETLSHDNVNEIIKIQISALVKPKTLLWSPSMSGKFFSKNAYHVFQSNRDSDLVTIVLLLTRTFCGTLSFIIDTNCFYGASLMILSLVKPD